MNDRELLELAAKAAGHSPWGSDSQGYPLFIVDGVPVGWNPITDHADRYRLARDLRMCIDFNSGHVVAALGVFEHEERFDPADQASEALAVVRAAAEIGKAMP